ncbi:rieske [2fe-2s] domain-containing protein [Cardiosporidium cionae]|uniref:Rieske [2fe-2s] domain-containing protein n=1 Tax=Cardiosporidium cionae TaxID=476202 RepID=A0ABQ7JEJ3_9APIC|nr:rieske [2fe-2s] domain-containing protein [Cardiosporidium cionae]|eukprot:KAF8822418.1 rieske [2fe-2s] domain-containing protein [Cardiosporidium cionae]
MESSTSTLKWFPACSIQEVRNRAKRCIIEGRPVAIWMCKGKPFALDANCYHAGGPLEQSAVDLEEIAGQACTRCPVHHYIISVETGESYYRAVTFEGLKGEKVPVMGDYTSKGRKQRTHFAKIEGDIVFVALNLSPEHLASDDFINLRISA